MHILIISPLHDLATFHSSHIATQLRNLLRHAENVVIRHISAWQSNGTVIRWALEKAQWDLICYFGHGKADGLRTNMGYVVQSTTGNLYKNAIFFTMACSAGKQFGDEIIDQGARAFIGNSEIVWGALPRGEFNYAAHFRNVWLNEILFLIQGETVANTVQYAKQKWEEVAIACPDPEIGVKARTNGTYHLWWGDGSARVPSPIPSSQIDLSALEMFPVEERC
jgi:hypothetical protein